MLVKMRKQVFETLEDSVLGAACYDPMIPEIRGKDIKVKQKVYKGLSAGQQALFMFKAFYNHASKSLAEFYWWSTYYWAQPKAWSKIKDSFRYFNADEMLSLFRDLEEVLEKWNYPRSLDEFAAAYNDIEKDPSLFAAISPLNAKFNEISFETLKKVGHLIRNNPNEFIHFDD